MPILGIWASQISGKLYNNSYDALGVVTVGAGGASTVTFNSIPSTYQHLQIRWIARNANNSPFLGSGLFLTMNSDTSSTYWNHGLYGTGSATGAFSQSNTGYMNIVEAISNDATANVFSSGVLDILDYANTNKNKTVRSLFGVDRNGGGNVSLYSASWTNTSAINALTFTPQTSPFQQYTQFALYGVK